MKYFMLISTMALNYYCHYYYNMTVSFDKYVLRVRVLKNASIRNPHEFFTHLRYISR